MAADCSGVTSVPTAVTVEALICPEPVHPDCCHRMRRLYFVLCGAVGDGSNFSAGSSPAEPVWIVHK